MERIIKFKCYSGQGDMIPSDYNDDFYIFVMGNGSPELLALKEDGSDYYTDDKAVFMQYTGLKDKNGKEIYEGDIIEFDFWYFENDTGFGEWQRKREQVIFNNGMFQVPKEYDDPLCWLFTVDEREIEDFFADDPESYPNIGLIVVGNIYETPNLLSPIGEL